MVVQEDVSPPPPAMAGGNQLPFEQVQFAAGCGVVHELAGGAGTLPGGCQLPLTHTQVAPGLIVVHVEVLPPPEVPPAAGATQLPLTQVQPVPGLGVVHELATGTLPGGCQLPLMHTQVAPGLIVVHVVEPPVDPPPVESAPSARGVELVANHLRYHLRVGTRRDHQPLIEPGVALGPRLHRQGRPRHRQLDLLAGRAVAVDFNAPHFRVGLALIVRKERVGNRVVAKADAVTAALGCQRDRGSAKRLGASIGKPSLEHPRSATETPGDREVLVRG